MQMLFHVISSLKKKKPKKNLKRWKKMMGREKKNGENGSLIQIRYTSALIKPQVF